MDKPGLDSNASGVGPGLIVESHPGAGPAVRRRAGSRAEISPHCRDLDTNLSPTQTSVMYQVTVLSYNSIKVS